MIFSLVVPTIGRVRELESFLASVQDQKLRSFALSDIEVIVVDQNGDGRLDTLTAKFRTKFDLKHLKIKPKGLSNARNAGMALAGGDIIAFPDDDCFYDLDALEKVYEFFGKNENRSGLFIRAMDPQTREDFLKYPKAGKIIRSLGDPDVFLGISISQFYPKEAVRATGPFDERFGIGGIWGSGEETDYAIRVLEKGFPIQFEPEIVVYHEKINPLASKNIPEDKVRAYSKGFGAMCRKHGLSSYLFLKVVKQLVGSFLYALALDFKRSRICWITAGSRLRGYRSYRDEGVSFKR